MSSWRVRSPHLVGHWTLNSHADDVSGYGNNGTWAGTEAYADGPFGKMVGDLNGSNAYVSVGTSSLYDFTSGDFSVSMWYRPDDVSGTEVMFYKGAVNVNGYYLAKTNAAMNFVTNQSGATQTTQGGTFVAGAWTHVVCVRNGAIARIYFDGSEVTYALQPAVTSPVSSSDAALIGAYTGPALYTAAEITDVMVYNIALTGDEVVEVMEMGQL